jgi:hypothetical protein
MFILGSVGMGPGGSSIPGSPGDTIRYGMDTGEGWLATSNLYNDGINIGINTLFPEDILHVAGNIILEEQLRIKTSYEPMILDTDEVKVYLTSGQYIGPGYFDKYVKLCNKGENGEEIIISSYLI